MNTWDLAPRARQDLRDIHEYIAQRSPQAAARYLDAIFAKFDTLAKLPYLGPPCEEIAADLRWFLARNHVIYYKSREDGVDIVRVLHGHRDVKSVFGEAAE
jgi:toxin ParE1/3/4